MPWLALPFGDGRKASLSRLFKVQGIPTLVAIGPSGKTVTTEARNLIMCHGAEAFPFTEERMEEIEAEIMAKGWPEKLKHKLHEHELLLTKRLAYMCDECNESGETGRLFVRAILAYSYTPEKFSEVEQIEKARREADTGDNFGHWRL
ncbi:hypothetical protein K7X08_011227 [Anisodus acutangulus]|uniref:Uncharacterized protein n=1 Tax=Anisodus acutangulus TaxID=402998 RepID=A0A9Q1RAX8_9SOLA|nr:hypothetical protein K7X08_011227 [Anisodus acutangulus]